MRGRYVQMVMAATGYHKDGIDGIIGPQSMKSVARIEEDLKADYAFNPEKSSQKRRLVAATQACLKKLGYDPGVVDGYEGPDTTEGMNAFLYKAVHGKEEVVERKPIPAGTGANNGNIPKQSECEAVYGKPGPAIERQLVLIEFPFHFYYGRSKVRRMRVHKLAAQQLKKALIEVHDHYGEPKWRELGLDDYAGTYNHRSMRGGTKWSMHAYGCAIDLHPAGNGLRTRCPQALFCKPEYKDFLDIMEANEWLPALRLWGADGMHFQRARMG